jgi:hypothetical protein
MSDPTQAQKADMKAQSLVPQIVKTHDELVEAETNGFNQALRLAIELGLLLKLAKEAVYHGHWEAWFKQQEFKFSHRTANRYMRLAKDREKLEEAANSPRVADMAAEGGLSVRAAERLLRPEKGDEATKTKKPPKPPKSESSSSPGLTELMKNCGSDEIKTAMKQAQGYDEVMKTPLEDLIKDTPESVLVTALTEAFDEDELQSLVRAITARLGESKTAVPKAA